MSRRKPVPPTVFQLRLLVAAWLAVIVLLIYGLNGKGWN